MLTTLFIFRLLSATLLLIFIGGIASLIYQESRTHAALLTAQQEPIGKLRVIKSKSDGLPAGAIFPLMPITSIGRAANSNITLTDASASSNHALITRRGQLWQVEDVGSCNGTLLNGVLLEGIAVISPGDIITISGTEFKLEYRARARKGNRSPLNG